ncbi:MAG: phospholipase C [Bacillota bacterium]
MKKKLIGIATVAVLLASSQSNVIAHEFQVKREHKAIPYWSAEEPHEEGVNSHLWIVNRAIEIMERNETVVQPNEIELLNQWKKELERGIYTADWENPYYDNYTFTSHFYDPDTEGTYIPFAKHAKETGTKYFRIAGEAYQKNDLNQAFFNLGLSLHYFGDLNQPMHAANFTNVSHPFGFHSKYENFVDTIKDSYRVSGEDGNWNFAGDNPGSWLHSVAVEAKKDFPSIVNDETEWWFVQAATSDYYAEKWRNAVTPATGKRLKEAQRVMAGYIHLWFETYVNKAKPLDR